MSDRQTDKLCGRAAAVAAIKAGIADVLILKDLDRATRDAYDGLALQREAKAEGWRIVTTKGEARAASVSRDAHAQKRGHSRNLDRGSEHVSSDRSILKGCRGFIGCKSPALAENYRGVLPGRKWRT